jgi:hypothetical protein
MSNLQALLIAAAVIAGGVLTSSLQTGAQNQYVGGVAAVSTVQGAVWIIIGSQVWVCESKVCVKQTLT